MKVYLCRTSSKEKWEPFEADTAKDAVEQAAMSWDLRDSTAISVRGHGKFMVYVSMDYFVERARKNK